MKVNRCHYFTFIRMYILKIYFCELFSIYARGGKIMAFLYLTEHGLRIIKSEGKLVISRDDITLNEIPIKTIEGIVLGSSVQISSAVITKMFIEGVPMTWITQDGTYLGNTVNVLNTDVFKQKKQFSFLDEQLAYDALSRKVIGAKVNNQLVILRRYNRNNRYEAVDKSIDRVTTLSKHLATTEDYQQLMGYEGIIGREYFSAYASFLPSDFSFLGRKRRPPTDPVNSMLSFGYKLLFNEIFTFVNQLGLNPYVGFLHRLGRNHASLVSDLMEEWRAVMVDSLVMALIHRKIITSDMFEFIDGACYFKKNSRNLFLCNFRKKLNASNCYVSSRSTYQESIFHQCKSYAAALAADNLDMYNPILIR